MQQEGGGESGGAPGALRQRIVGTEEAAQHAGQRRVPQHALREPRLRVQPPTAALLLQPPMGQLADITAHGARQHEEAALAELQHALVVEGGGAVVRRDGRGGHRFTEKRPARSRILLSPF